MSLVGFKGRNHPQQTGKRGPRPEVDDRATPPEVFAPLHERFRFTLDACALPHNAKLPHYFTPEDDGLSQPWMGERVWCNPPFSHIEPWVVKARAEVESGCPLAVLLVPANRTEQRWWQEWVEPCRDSCADVEPHLAVEFLSGRLRFIAHNATGVAANERPPFGCCLLIFSHAHPRPTQPPCSHCGQPFSNLRAFVAHVCPRPLHAGAL